ncbi:MULTISPECIES: Gfo/Idh/MocA family protein [unclassified Brevibacterium]|uniref:Gfo/Idh/MocA family protein n=1 Tax=unclassified Brevibacterium TaxID=2614124 RepID=UPI001092919E|nr:Gfo/Idh/MocA family oxidoreductase [Brevibacterium sp. S22]TGD32757.1 gfo/Idh/MocA family oxidoreductase [Brevibacterium sp. S22]
MVNVAHAAPQPPRIGILGGGFMARVHSRAARSASAALDSVAASNPSRSAEVAAELGFAQPAAGAELFARSLDVIHICTPNDVHAAQSLQALDTGSNIICEKPLATNSVEARAVLARAEAAGLRGTVPFVYRYHPMVREARARFREGQAGTLLTVDAGYLQDWLLGSGDENWRVESERGGPSRAFADIGSHLVDLIEFIVGDRISSLVATTRTVHPRRGGAPVTTEDTVAVTVEFAGGAIGSLLVSQLAPGRKNGLTVEIAGTEASMRFEQEQPENLWFGRRADSRLLVRDPDTLSADAARLCEVPAGHPQGYQDAFNAFVADSYALFAGEPRDGVPLLADGLRAVLITEAVLKSVEQRSWVEVESL